MKSFLNQTTGIFACMLMLAGCIKGPDRDIEKRIFVNHTSLEMFVDDKIQITASPTNETFTWKSEDASVATVGSSGEVRATGLGETNIIVGYGDLQRSIPVKVIMKIPVAGISVSDSPIDLEEGNTATLKASLLPENFNEKEQNILIWQSSNLSVATVEDGVVSAVGMGSAVITATLERNPSIKLDIPTKVFKTERGVNVALKKPVTVSSVSQTFVGTNAVDGNKVDLASRWVAVYDPANSVWIEVDLQGDYFIGSFGTWLDARAAVGEARMKQYIFQAWIKGEWQDIVSEYNREPDRTNDIEEYIKNFRSVTTGRVRLFIPPYVDNYIRMYELEVYTAIKIYE